MNGFRGQVNDFLIFHPGYHINSLHVYGSNVETMFGQLKHTTGGNLTGCSHKMAMAKATLLTKRAVHYLIQVTRHTPDCQAGRIEMNICKY